MKKNGVQWTRFTQVRYALASNIGNVTVDCFSELSPRCSLTEQKLCIHVHDNSEVQNTSDIESRKQAPQNSLVCIRYSVQTSYNQELTSLCFFFTFWPWITARNWYLAGRRSTVRLRSVSSTPRSPVFNLLSAYHHKSALLSLGITIAVRQRKPALLWNNEQKFSKNHFWSLLEFAKMPGYGAEFSRRDPRHRTKQHPRAGIPTLTPGAKSYKCAGNLKLFEMNITFERKEINSNITFERKELISNFERKSSVESLAQNILEFFRFPLTPATCHSPMTDISVMRPLRRSFSLPTYQSHGTRWVNSRKWYDTWTNNKTNAFWSLFTFSLRIIKY